MTDPEFADATYVEPITPEFVEKVIAKERPDALLATLGGQTALNAAMALARARRPREVRRRADRRQRRGDRRAARTARSSRAIVAALGAESARSRHLPLDGRAASRRPTSSATRWSCGPSFTMGGAGSGIAYDEDDLRRIAGAGPAALSPTTEVLLEESILGWKEYELEVMRDHADNVVVVCSIENLDPMGVHTGDSITVAPAMTLTDREYQRLRDIGIGVIRAVGVDTGGCNIQFAVNPADGRVIVIEMNPRVSRSSARWRRRRPASRSPRSPPRWRSATPSTRSPTTSPARRRRRFEPTLDYVVVKVPRFAFEKFPGADPTLTTHMKSVGEAMAIGRNFTEALQKALRSLEKQGRASSTGASEWVELDKDALLEAIQDPARRPAAQGAWTRSAAGATAEEVFEATGIDPWFLDQMALINEVADEVADAARARPRTCCALAKRHGFSDAQIGRAARHARGRRARRAARARHPAGLQDRRHLRRRVRRADAVPLLVLRRGDRGRAARAAGGASSSAPGPNRIGQGIEFDYSCVHAVVRAARRRATRR